MTRFASRLVRPIKWLRLAALGIVGWVVLFGLTVSTLGSLYIWLMTGLSPISQVRDAGLASLVAWPLGALFAALQVAGAFLVERPYGPWGIVGATLGLLGLWVLALRRGKAHRHPILKDP